MRELALHVLDLIENATRAGASIVRVSIIEDVAADTVEVHVEDDGPGLPVSAEQAMDPFYTTKQGKRTGLGLSLFRAAAEQAGGQLAVTQSELGGVAVRATMRLGHVDRSPMGDLAGTLALVAGTNPDVDIWCRVRTAAGECLVRASDIAAETSRGGGTPMAATRRMAERIREAMAGITA